MPKPEPALPFTDATLGYTHNPLDRMANDRDAPNTIPALLQDEAARVLVFNRDTVFLSGTAPASDPWFTVEQANRFGTATERVFLGRDGIAGRFAMRFELPSEQNEGMPPSADLRSMATSGQVAPAVLGILAEAKALLHWHATHRFCSACGQRSVLAAQGWRRECPTCGTHHFPRTDPVVIMLAVQGDRCLLGRQPRFVPGMYSCLAGFLEPGETIEAGVRRELQEEAGLATGVVTYLGSQPWPFPASIMIGCLAEAIDARLSVDHAELEDARWFTRAEVLQMLSGRHPAGLTCPPPMAIAHALVRAWAGEDHA